MDYEAFYAKWPDRVESVEGIRYRCGHCNADAGATRGLLALIHYRHNNHQNIGKYAQILFCPVCSQPSYTSMDGKQFPGIPVGAPLKNLPAGIAGLYREARDCASIAAYTACVMACRKRKSLGG